MSRNLQNGRFTGRHMLAVICGGFSVVIAVNIALATFATRSHPGLVVENSYVASQKFNDWLAEGRAQKALGWDVGARAEGQDLVLTAQDSRGQPLAGLKAVATVAHPMGAEPPRELRLAEVAPGRYVARHQLAAGQWNAEVRLSRGSQHYYLRSRLVTQG